jgi:hypothetical protein
VHAPAAMADGLATFSVAIAPIDACSAAVTVRLDR